MPQTRTRWHQTEAVCGLIRLGQSTSLDDAIKALEELHPDAEIDDLSNNPGFDDVQGKGVVTSRDKNGVPNFEGAKARQKNGKVSLELKDEVVHMHERPTKGGSTPTIVTPGPINFTDIGVNYGVDLSNVVTTEQLLEAIGRSPRRAELMNRLAAQGTDFSSMTDQKAYDRANRLGWGNLTDEQKAYFKDNNFGFNFGPIADFGAWNDAGAITEGGGTGESDPSPSPVGNPPGDR